MMILTNEFVNSGLARWPACALCSRLLSPFAPMSRRALGAPWREVFRFQGRASSQPGPNYDENLLAVDEVEYAVQVQGKVRDRMLARKEAPDSELEEAALATPKIREAVAGKAVLRIIIVRDKLVNIVLGK